MVHIPSRQQILKPFLRVGYSFVSERGDQPNSLAELKRSPHVDLVLNSRLCIIIYAIVTAVVELELA